MYKSCPHCNIRNLDFAKYCLSCEQEFDAPKKNQKTSKKPSRPITNRKIFTSSETLNDELEEVDFNKESISIDSDLTGIIKIQVEERQSGVKLEDVIGTSTGGRNTLGRRQGDKRSGQKILREEGGNTRKK